MRIPLWAPTPVPTITAVGVAKPRAHGHAITRTEIACTNTSLMLYKHVEQGAELLLVLSYVFKFVVLTVSLPA